MKSKVYFVKADNSEGKEIIKAKLWSLLSDSNLFDFIEEKDRAVIKMHFGEEGNTGFVSPVYVRKVVDKLIEKRATCSLVDTNTLYRGRRTNSSDHLLLAHEHGFTEDVVLAEVIIPDDTKKENTAEIEINQRFIKTAKLARIFVDADVIIGIAHFKGHIMTGFGGALKNLGMGCATREGKLSQHADVSPFINKKKCIGCGSCETVCLTKAITIKDKIACLDSSKCVGCASCIAVCKYYAVDIPWESGGGSIQQKMVEYTKAVLNNKNGKAIFINFATKITKECDCLARDDPKISPDVGIFISRDPVSIDKACFDLINNTCQKDIFKEAHAKRDGLIQIRHAAKIGLGSMEYELVELK